MPTSKAAEYVISDWFRPIWLDQFLCIFITYIKALRKLETTKNRHVPQDEGQQHDLTSLLL